MQFGVKAWSLGLLILGISRVTVLGPSMNTTGKNGDLINYSRFTAEPRVSGVSNFQGSGFKMFGFSGKGQNT